jgi:hypothetical protein
MKPYCLFGTNVSSALILLENVILLYVLCIIFSLLIVREKRIISRNLQL